MDTFPIRPRFAVTFPRALPMLRLLFGGFFLLAVTTACAVGQEAPSRLKVPAGETLAAAKKLIGEVYKSEYEAAKTPVARQAFAKKLLADAEKTSDDPTSRFALLQIAHKVAGQAGDLDLAYAAANLTARHYEISAATLKCESLAEVAPTLRAPIDHYFFGRYAERLLPELRQAAAWDKAAELADLAEASAKKNRDVDLAKLWKDRKAEIVQLKQAFTAAAPALAQLDKSPADPALNEQAGKLNCFLLEAWTTGIPMLALGADPALQKEAEAELRAPTSTVDRLALADAWYGLAKTLDDPARSAVYRHAYASYREALPNLEGLAKAKVQVRADDCFLQGLPDRVPLSILKPVLIEGLQYAPDAPIFLSSPVAGRTYHDSLWAHPPSDGDSRIVFELPAGCKYLMGGCAFKDIADDHPHNTVRFSIVGTTGELWRSPDFKELNKLVPFKVDLKGQKRIELICHCNGFNGASHAVWVEPLLQK
jgi:hypothetical protein